MSDEYSARLVGIWAGQRGLATPGPSEQAWAQRGFEATIATARARIDGEDPQVAADLLGAAVDLVAALAGQGGRAPCAKDVIDRAFRTFFSTLLEGYSGQSEPQGALRSTLLKDLAGVVIALVVEPGKLFLALDEVDDALGRVIDFLGTALRAKGDASASDFQVQLESTAGLVTGMLRRGGRDPYGKEEVVGALMEIQQGVQSCFDHLPDAPDRATCLKQATIRTLRAIQLAMAPLAKDEVARAFQEACGL